MFSDKPHDRRDVYCAADYVDGDLALATGPEWRRAHRGLVVGRVLHGGESGDLRARLVALLF